MFSIFHFFKKKSRILNGTKLDKILPPSTCLESQMRYLWLSQVFLNIERVDR